MKLKNKNLSKKLLSYSVLTGGTAMMLNPTALNSLLRHVDPVDIVVTNDTLSIDLSGDGTKDFIFRNNITTNRVTTNTVSSVVYDYDIFTRTNTTSTITTTTFSTTTTPSGGYSQHSNFNTHKYYTYSTYKVYNTYTNFNKYYQTYTNKYCSMNMKAGGKGIRLDNCSGFIEKLNTGAPINNSLSMSSNDAAFKKLCYYSSYATGNPQHWANSTGFIGVKFDIGADTHFGWIRVSVGNTMEDITIHDWGYNNNSLGAINAGDFDAGGIWTGAFDSNWNDTRNWNDGIIPTNISNIIIPDVSGESGNFPILSGSGDCQNITIENGAILTINSSQILNISGNVVLDNGSGLTNNGDLKFVGNDCHLSDNRVNKTTIGNVIID